MHGWGQIDRVESARFGGERCGPHRAVLNGPSTASPVLGPFSFDTRGGELASD